MKVKAITTLLLALLLAFFIACEKNPVSGDCPSEQRTGAVCNYVTISTATGSGAGTTEE